MNRLNINYFIVSAYDYEWSQYKVLSILKNYNTELHSNKLFPVIDDLKETYNNLTQIVKQRDEYQKYLSQKFNSKNDEDVEYEIREIKEKTDDPKVNTVFEFIEWALPRIKETLEEAKVISDFIEENINIKEIGLISLYNNEGYLIVPDNKMKSTNVYRFENYIISPDGIEINTLKTKFVLSYDKMNSDFQLRKIKLDLINKFKDLPNPATYNCETDLDFPFEESIFPIAKKKLITKLDL